MNERVRASSVIRSAALIALIGLPLVSSAQEFHRGKALYEHHCQGCHESWAHERAGRRVTSLGELRQRVAGWSFHGGLDWGDEEINDVTDYLNAQYYQMTK